MHTYIVLFFVSVNWFFVILQSCRIEPTDGPTSGMHRNGEATPSHLACVSLFSQ